MTNYNDGLWHGWNGGECPVHPESIVEVATTENNGSKSNGKGSIAAKEYVWGHATIYRIIAFRVVKEFKEPREFWIVGNSEAWTSKKDAIASLEFMKSKEIIHVREVIDE